MQNWLSRWRLLSSSIFVAAICSAPWFDGAFAYAQTSAQAAPNFFYSGGKAHLLRPSTRWAGAQLTVTTSGTRLERAFRSHTALDRSRGAKHYGRRHILLLPVRGGAVSTRQALNAQLRNQAGVRRAIRVFESGRADRPIVETDELLVQFQPSISYKQAARLVRQYGAVLGAPLGHYAPNGYVAHVTDAARTATGVANALYGKPQVVFSHPNFIWPMQPRYVPNDPLFPQQWQLHNTGQSGGTAGADIKAEPAWDITRGNPSLIVAVIDTGIDIDHEEFKGKVVPGYDEVEKNSDPRPKDGGSGGENHGTEVAGLAVAAGSNGLGISGVAPNCKLLPIRAIVDGVTDQDLADAFGYAADHGAAVINNSWGPTDGTGMEQPLPDALRAGIDYAVTRGRGGKGCVITWASGNGQESADLDGYSSNPNVISVAASTNADRHAFYSDYGNSVDVCAPSSDSINNVVTSDRTGQVGDSIDNYTNNFGGTSAATPIAAGTAALMLSVNPNLTYTQVRDILVNSADKIDRADGAYDSAGHSKFFGFGRINALRALQAAEVAVPTISLLTPPTNATINGTYTLRAKTSNDAVVKRVDFARRSQDDVGSGARAPKIAIPDLGTITDALPLSSSGMVESGTVSVDITHPSPSDLILTLIAPDGTRTVVYNHDPNDFAVTSTGLDLTRPLSLTGKKISGAWKLEISDTVSGNSGILNSWSLRFTSNWVPIASATKPVSGQWTAIWNTATSPGTYEVSATAITAGASAMTENRNVHVAVPHSISGTVTNSLNVGLANVTLTLHSSPVTVSAAQTTKTASNGTYTFSNVMPGNYVVQPTLSGATFTAPIRAVTVSAANVTNVNFTTPPDRTAPTVAVTKPAVAPHNHYTALGSASGTASDNVGGSGLAQITGLLYRCANGATPAGYWNGTAWNPTYNTATDERVATGTTSWNLVLPHLAAGSYTFRATAKDKAGNLAHSTTIAFLIGSITTKSVPPMPPSTLTLSASNVVAATASIQLRFAGALEAETASDAAHYAVTINGRAVMVESAGYNAITHTVTLALPERSLRLGDAVTVYWAGVLDEQGAPLNGQAGPLATH